MEILKVVDQLKQPKTQTSEETEVTLVVDRTKQTMATLIKLNSLQKRVNFINHFVGEWKPTPRYKSIAM
jgi:hypothetical protein